MGGVEKCYFLSSSPPWFGESTHQKFILFDTWTGSRRAEKEHFVFLFCYVCANAFYYSSSTLICIPILSLFGLGVFNIARIVMVILWAVYPPPVLFGLFR
jgi:hypothetical protein